MKTKYDDEVEKLERDTAKVEARLKKLKQERDKITKPYDTKISRIQKTLQEGYQEIVTLKHNREIWIRNQELQKNKDLFSKGMSFKDLVLTGDGRFSDYQYFLKSGTEVIPRLHFSVEGTGSRDELTAKLKGILSENEINHLDGFDWGIPKFTPDIPIEVVRKLYQAGFKFKSFSSNEEHVEFCESDKTRMVRRQRGSKGTYFPLSYTRNPETVTVVRKGTA